jgi:hypothetical protein
VKARLYIPYTIRANRLSPASGRPNQLRKNALVMIPDTRPVCGKDLQEIKQNFGLKTNDVLVVLGFSITRWTTIACDEQEASKPLADPTLALLARFLDQHPETEVIARHPKPLEMYKLLNKIYAGDAAAEEGDDESSDVDEVDATLSAAEFGALFGGSTAAGNRWIKPDAGRISPSVTRLMLHMRSALLARPAARRKALLNEWSLVAAQESKVRQLVAEGKSPSPDVAHSGVGVIPAFRPVLGKDLQTIAQLFGLKSADAIALFGLSITKWGALINAEPEKPISDLSLALLVRFLDNHPDLAIGPKYPGVAEMFELINTITPTDQKTFSVLFGSDATAAYRWLKKGSKKTPAVERLMFHLKNHLLSKPKKPAQIRQAALAEWQQTVALEAKLRGSEDIFRTGKWFSKNGREGDEESGLPVSQQDEATAHA